MKTHSHIIFLILSLICKRGKHLTKMQMTWATDGVCVASRCLASCQNNLIIKRIIKWFVSSGYSYRPNSTAIMIVRSWDCFERLEKLRARNLQIQQFQLNGPFKTIKLFESFNQSAELATPSQSKLTSSLRISLGIHLESIGNPLQIHQEFKLNLRDCEPFELFRELIAYRCRKPSPSKAMKKQLLESGCH